MESDTKHTCGRCILLSYNNILSGEEVNCSFSLPTGCSPSIIFVGELHGLTALHWSLPALLRKYDKKIMHAKICFKYQCTIYIWYVICINISIQYCKFYVKECQIPPVLHNARLMSFVERFLKGVVQNWMTAENGSKPLRSQPAASPLEKRSQEAYELPAPVPASNRQALRLNWFCQASIGLRWTFGCFPGGHWMHVHWANPSWQLPWQELQLGTLPSGLVSIQLVVGEVTFRIYLSNQAIMPCRRRS